MNIFFGKSVHVLIMSLFVLLCTLSVNAVEKTVNFSGINDDALARFSVHADGSKIYFTTRGQGYAVLDADGKLLITYNWGNTKGIGPAKLLPLPDGWFVACNAGIRARVDLCRPDFTLAKTIGVMGRAFSKNTLSIYFNGGCAVDSARQYFFINNWVYDYQYNKVLQAGIHIVDFDGRVVLRLNTYRHDAEEGKPERDLARAMNYSDIEVDPQRQRIFATTRDPQQLLVFSYNGDLLSRLTGRGGVAVFPDGRVAVAGMERSSILIYDAELTTSSTLAVPAEYHFNPNANMPRFSDLNCDAAGRLYVSLPGHRTILFARWAPDLKTHDVVQSPYITLNVDFGNALVRAGEMLEIKASATGKREVIDASRWQAYARPADGSNLRWQSLPVTAHDGKLVLDIAPGMQGVFELVVGLTTKKINLQNITAEPALSSTMLVIPQGTARQSIAIFTSSGRSAFQQGESIATQIVRQSSEAAAPVEVEAILEHDTQPLSTMRLTIEKSGAFVIPAAVTHRLPPGRYTLRPVVEGYNCFPLVFDIASALQDSPLQRIILLEMGAWGTSSNLDSSTSAMDMAYTRDYLQAMHDTGFNRISERSATNWVNGINAWQRERYFSKLTDPAAAPAAYYARPDGRYWAAEYFLDQAVRHGIKFDTMVMPHCGSAAVSISSQDLYLKPLQRIAQWLGRYPSFYGFNYNDELYVSNRNLDKRWSKDDQQELDRLIQEEFAGQHESLAKMTALQRMYARFNAAVNAANPRAKTTTAMLWQGMDYWYAPVVYQGMSESMSHWISEGYSVPWYVPHSVEHLRRPGLPLMAVFDKHGAYYGDSDGSEYAKNAMLAASRGVQGVGIQHLRPFYSPYGTAYRRLTNDLLAMYGPVFAEAEPVNEGAILLSRTFTAGASAGTLGHEQWQRVYALYGAALMSGVPMPIIYEEDIAAGWLLNGAAPRVPMLFMVGVNKPLPAEVDEAIASFTAAGGKIFIDAASNDYPKAAKLAFDPASIRELLSEGYSADSVNSLLHPQLEAMAASLRQTVGAFRRFPLDSSDPWVSASSFAGGDIRYIMLASEAGPFPWDAGEVWRSNAYYSFRYSQFHPKTPTLTLPAVNGVLYDVFNRREVALPPAQAGKTVLPVDLTAYPGRLYAIAPAPLGAPRLETSTDGEEVAYRVTVTTRDGKVLPARVPLRIRLMTNDEVAQELYRGTGLTGSYEGSFALPATSAAWTLEICELISGQAAAASVESNALPKTILENRPAVEFARQEQLRNLLAQAKSQKVLPLVMAEAEMLSPAQIQALSGALKAQNITLEVHTAVPEKIMTGVSLAAGYVLGTNSLGGILTVARTQGLFDTAINTFEPGAGRGQITALFAPREYGEDVIALLGGDAPGLAQTIDAFVNWLQAQPAVANALPANAPVFQQNGAAVTISIPTLSDRSGIQLSAITATPDGKHLLVAADGYQQNIALLETTPAGATVVRAERVGQAPHAGSLYLGGDGKFFGASGRTLAAYGQRFDIFRSGGGKHGSFAGFGDIGKLTTSFTATDNGDSVIVTGTYGVVCWQRAGEGWREAWAIDYWQGFKELEWVVSADQHRIPQFNAYIPRGADYALILFSEFSTFSWHTSMPCEVWLAAVNLANGKERWRFDVPIEDRMISPLLHFSADKQRLLLQLQEGMLQRNPSTYYLLENGKSIFEWRVDSDREGAVSTPTIALATTGEMALMIGERLLELRHTDGQISLQIDLPRNVLDLAFSLNGQSLYIADQHGDLACLGNDGLEQWRVELGAASSLAVAGTQIFAAGRDGRVRAISDKGELLWTVDCTPQMHVQEPLAALAAMAARQEQVNIPARPSTTSATVPAGDNLLRNGKATMTVGGTRGWMSSGKVQVTPEVLTNGTLDDVENPWFTDGELFWTATAGRQVWAEITFAQPTDVKALTVYEHTKKPDCWPTEAIVQIWNEDEVRWKTAAWGGFLQGAVNTYHLNLLGVKKLRYVPWNSYFHHLYTSEIEVR